MFNNRVDNLTDSFDEKDNIGYRQNRNTMSP